MATVQTINGDVVITGNLRVGGTISPPIAKSSILVEASLQPFTIPMARWREHDAYATVLSVTPVADNHLGLVGGTHGTNAPSLKTSDCGGNGGENFYARGEIQLPWEYIAAGSVTIRVHAGMLTTVASESCTVDLQVYKSDEDSTSAGDLCATAAQDMNSLVFGDLDFVITSTSLNPGDLLDVLIDVAVDDDDDEGEIYGCVGSVQLLCDVR